MFASKFGKIEIIPKTHQPANYTTVRDAIGYLSQISDGESDIHDPLHKASRLSPLNKLRILNTSQGGGWKDWDESLVLRCHKKETGKSYCSIYGRMKWDAQAPTITTQCYGYGNGRFGHPEQNRAISLREAALIQTFPEYYDFIDSNVGVSVKTIGRHIGNAVPVRLGQIVAMSIERHLNVLKREFLRNRDNTCST